MSLSNWKWPMHQIPNEPIAFKVPGSNANHPRTGEPFYELAWEPDQNDAGDEEEWTREDTKRVEHFRSTQVRDRVWNDLIGTRPAVMHDSTPAPAEGDEDDGRDVLLCRQLAESAGWARLRSWAQCMASNIVPGDPVSAEAIRLLGTWRPGTNPP